MKAVSWCGCSAETLACCHRWSILIQIRRNALEKKHLGLQRHHNEHSNLLLVPTAPEDLLNTPTTGRH